MKVSVIIPTIQRTEYLRKSLASILQQTRLPEEIIIVDQSDNDETRKLVEEMRCSPTGRLIQFQYVKLQEKSTAKARNFGALLAQGDLISFIDDDVVLFKNYFEKVLLAFQNDASLGGVTGNVVLRKKLSGWKWRVRKVLLKVFLLNNFKGRMTVSGFGYPFFDFDDRDIKEPVEVELFSGYSMNFKRKYLIEDLVDEWFTGYSFREDVDFTYRISHKTKLMLIPDARFWHLSAPSNRLDEKRLKRMQIRNYYYVFRKHKYWNFFSNFLFAYSLSGLILIDLLEFLTSQDPKKLSKLKAGVKASLKLPGETQTEDFERKGVGVNP